MLTKCNEILDFKIKMFSFEDVRLRPCIMLSLLVPLDQMSHMDLLPECPIDCKVTTFRARITDSRFLHAPPKGISPLLINAELFRKNKNSSHLLNIYNTLNGTDLDAYIE